MTGALREVALLRTSDGKPVKEARAVRHVSFHGRLKEALEHAHGKRLAKATRSAKEGYVKGAVEKIPDQERLVHIDASGDDLLEVLAPYGKPVPPRPVDNRRSHSTPQSLTSTAISILAVDGCYSMSTPREAP